MSFENRLFDHLAGDRKHIQQKCDFTISHGLNTLWYCDTAGKFLLPIGKSAIFRSTWGPWGICRLMYGLYNLGYIIYIIYIYHYISSPRNIAMDSIGKHPCSIGNPSGRLVAWQSKTHPCYRWRSVRREKYGDFPVLGETARWLG